MFGLGSHVMRSSLSACTKDHTNKDERSMNGSTEPGGGVKKSTPSESAEAPSATHHIHRLSTVLFLKGRGADTQDEV